MINVIKIIKNSSSMKKIFKYDNEILIRHGKMLCQSLERLIQNLNKKY